MREEKAEVVEPRAGGKLPYVLQNYIASILQLLSLILWTSEVDQIRHVLLYHSSAKNANLFLIIHKMNL